MIGVGTATGIGKMIGVFFNFFNAMAPAANVAILAAFTAFTFFTLIASDFLAMAIGAVMIAKAAAFLALICGTKMGMENGFG